jgi:hypothetical protein
VPERRAYGLIPSGHSPAVQHVLSSVRGRSKCGRPFDTALPIPRDLPICKKCTQFDGLTGAFGRRPWRGLKRRSACARRSGCFGGPARSKRAEDGRRVELRAAGESGPWTLGRHHR